MAVTDSVAGGLRAADLGATHLLLRRISASAGEQYRILCDMVGATPLPVLSRGRPDLALAAGAAGVNLPEDDIPSRDARSLLGDHRLIGRSVHSVAGAEAAASGPIDFLILGPIFPTPTHPWAPGLGLDVLAEAARRVGVPVLAIGGIDRGRAGECLAAGAAGYAAIRLFA